MQSFPDTSWYSVTPWSLRFSHIHLYTTTSLVIIDIQPSSGQTLPLWLIIYVSTCTTHESLNFMLSNEFSNTFEVHLTMNFNFTYRLLIAWFPILMLIGEVSPLLGDLLVVLCLSWGQPYLFSIQTACHSSLLQCRSRVERGSQYGRQNLLAS